MTKAKITKATITKTTITKEKVLHMARLARIKIKDEELPSFVKELSSILAFVEQLNDVDTDNIEPFTNLLGLELKDAVMNKRGDEVKTGNQRDEIMKNAPACDDGFFEVPKVIE